MSDVASLPQQGRSLMAPYLPPNGANSPYSEGGALYALGLIHANHGTDIRCGPHTHRQPCPWPQSCWKSKMGPVAPCSALVSPAPRTVGSQHPLTQDFQTACGDSSAATSFCQSQGLPAGEPAGD